jgi:hypothetical protein
MFKPFPDCRWPSNSSRGTPPHIIVLVTSAALRCRHRFRANHTARRGRPILWLPCSTPGTEFKFSLRAEQQSGNELSAAVFAVVVVVLILWVFLVALHLT